MKRIEAKHLLGLENISTQDIETIIDVGFTFREVLERPVKKVPALNGKNIVNLFFENSTRTKISFELAEKRLSADVTNFSASSSSVKKGESLRDTIQNIHVMKMDCVVMRHPIPGSCLQLSNYVDVPIVNAGDGTHEHPTQALLDMMSIKEKFGKIKGLNIGIVGDILHSRVALSNIFGLIKLGANVKLCAPPHLLQRHIEDYGVSITYDVDELIDWADAVNVLRIQRERMGVGLIPSIREYRKFFGITSERLSRHKKEIVIMHPGPINRGVEIDSQVADGDQAIILDQVLNGVAVRMSVLYLLLGSNDFD
ncbi:MAG: aspartate carbamoyltransferase [Candidatus Marinimicrobia bacterium]|nr:aspartate carbamoyltransferase [Candidatus Neomarinimicrobiota bacterium]|tara:strand:- start:10777 stop:11709 length:933 start_codon:yes stop_codon:yes gene_type:complete